ncbi:MAG: metallophosphoesterase [Clostridium sp.]|nr:metallophosphoesterase [Clostridium sp.]MCM1207766.1 metallophosphoesterase [Ruminococcus sp.]
MRRILIVSDSHGRNENVQKAIKKAGNIDMMIHLGDIGWDYLEVEHMSGVPTYMVAGNNDYGLPLKDRIIIQIGEHRIYAVHGHRQAVHFGPDTIRYHALENECDIAMYGHTHVPFLDDEGDVTILNPGSLTYPRQEGHEKTFVIMEIDDYDEVTYTFDHI